ncbi:MAG: NCS2 family permease [Coriobacteriales bacterium]|jgi:AGZA family xanthine/uracil permease-like MFS transporter
MDKFFKISERGSSVGNEIVCGLTTFLAMAYIIAVNPAMMVDAGMPFEAALTSTCFGAAIMTLAMGLITNRPVALASGMGINSIVAYTLCGTELGVDWRVAMAVVFLEGAVILVLVLVGLRKAIMDAIPASIRHSIGIGIGIFIAFLGLKNGGIITGNEDTLLSMGDFTSPAVIVSLISIILAIVLQALEVKGAMIISIIVAVIVGIPLGVTVIPTTWNFGLDFSAFAAPFQTDPSTGTLAIIELFTQPILLMYAFSLLMSDFFDTMGTVEAIGSAADFVDKDGNVENVQSILTVDSAAAMVGGFVGASSITTYAESTAGAAAGARTGLSNVVIAIMFIIFSFFSPVIGMVSNSATCGALVVVGYLMMKDVVNIDWTKIETAFPAFLTIAAIPFTASITNGIGLGFISYCIIMIAKGKAREVKPLMWVSAAAFLVMFILL